jgi:predicted RNA binding protein YcfA (HicA-like mRNA interferase family)
MPKLYSSKEIVKVLESIDFRFISQKGSHGKFKNTEGRTVIVPMNKKEIPMGTFRSIVKQSGIEVDHFTEKIKK